MSTPLSSSTSHSRSQSSSTPVANSAFEDYHRQMNQVLDQLDDKLQQYPIVQQIAGQTKVRPSYLAVGLVVALILFIFWGFGGRLVANIVGFGYPLYESFHSLKRKPLPGEVDEEDSQWLTYWVVYSTFTLLESFSNFLELWIPFYHLVKVAFLLWCFLPQTRGALYIYHHVIEPVLVRYESSIDAGRSKVKKSVTTVAKDMAEIGAAAIEAKTREVAQSAINSMISGQQSAAPGGPETEHTKSM